MITALSALGAAPLFAAAGAAGSGALSFVEPAFELGRQAGNRQVMPAVPSIESIIRAYATGTMKEDIARWCAKSQGVQLFSVRQDDDGPKRNAAWDAVFESSLFYYNPDDIVDLWLRGLVKDADFAKAFQRAGGYNEFLRVAKEANRGRFDVATIFALLNRGYLKPGDAYKEMKRATAMKDDDIYKLTNLSRPLPPVSDIIRFAIREVFNPQLAQDLQLSAEYTDNPKYKEMANAAGLNTTTWVDANGNEQSLDLPLAYWQAHWIQPSAGQAYDFFHRLRPGRLARFQQQFPDIQAFSLSDLKTLLRTNDYAPKWRSSLGAISSRPLGTREIKRVYRWGRIDETEVKELYLDLGLVNDDAERMAYVVTKEAKRQKDREDNQDAIFKHGKTINALVTAYQHGSVPQPLAMQKLISFGLMDEVAKDRLDNADIIATDKIVTAYIRAVKGEYFLGLYTQPRVVVELVNGGVDPFRANQLANLWARQLSRPRRVASAEKLMDWVRRGLITMLEAGNRMQVLGWSNEDTLLYLAQTEQDIERDKLKAQLAAEREADRRAAIAQRLAEKAIARKRQEQADFRKHSSETMMRQWLRDNLITEKEVVANLKYLDWPEEDIIRWLAETYDNANAEG